MMRVFNCKSIKHLLQLLHAVRVATQMDVSFQLNVATIFFIFIRKEKRALHVTCLEKKRKHETSSFSMANIVVAIN